jgi:hypothetical protein
VWLCVWGCCLLPHPSPLDIPGRAVLVRVCVCVLMGFLSLRDLELDSKKPTAEDSPLTRKIRQLENRLDKAMIKYNEAQVGGAIPAVVVVVGERVVAARTFGPQHPSPLPPTPHPPHASPT